jgi:hypothetical protein
MIDDRSILLVNRPNVPASLAQVVVHHDAQSEITDDANHDVARRAGGYCNAQMFYNSPHFVMAAQKVESTISWGLELAAAPFTAPPVRRLVERNRAHRVNGKPRPA